MLGKLTRTLQQCLPCLHGKPAKPTELQSVSKRTKLQRLYWNRVKRTCSRYEHQFSVDVGRWVSQPSNRSISGSVPQLVSSGFPVES